MKILVAMAVVLLSGCAGSEFKKSWVSDLSQKSFRDPASSDSASDSDTFLTDDAFETGFQRLMSSRDNAQFELRLQLRLDAIEETYFRTRKYVKKFDHDLNESVSNPSGSIDQFYSKQINSGSYPHLLALRQSQNLQEHYLLFLYQRFEKVLSDAQSSALERERAQHAIQYIGNYFQHLPLHFLIAHYPLGLELSSAGVTDPELKKGVDRILGHASGSGIQALLNHYADLYEDTEVQKAVDQKTTELESIQTRLSVKVDQVAQELQDGMKSDSAPVSESEKGRSPQSVQIAPGMGPEGNITGNSFPNGIWSITFDDGPHASYTAQVLENLHQNGMKATFFMLAKNASAYPQIARSEKEAGMESESHSYTHPQLPKLSEEGLNHEILEATNRIAEVLGERPKLFRCPYGAGMNIPRIRKLIVQGNLIHVFWNVDSLDWHDPNPNSVFARVKKQMALSKKGGGIILFHDIHPQSVVASKMVMEYLNENRLQEQPVGEVIDLINGK